MSRLKHTTITATNWLHPCSGGKRGAVLAASARRVQKCKKLVAETGVEEIEEMAETETDGSVIETGDTETAESEITAQWSQTQRPQNQRS